MFGNLLRPTHLFLILIIALVIFGPGRFSEVGTALGKAIRDFRSAVNNPEAGAENDVKEINESKDKK